MSIVRIRPVQDTFIVYNESNASFGADEILELGKSSRFDADGCARILVEFLVNEVEKVVEETGGVLSRATLNLKYAYAENLPPIWGIDCTEINSEWAEGVGHVNDLPGNTSGASWYHPKGICKEDLWIGGLTGPEDDYVWKHNVFTGYQADRDICLDVTEWVYQWIEEEKRGLGFLLKIGNEELAEKQRTRICFYSSETHTIYYPYLELLIADEVRPDPETVTYADPDNLVINTKNLKESYYIGDRARIDLLVRPEYPVRRFSTSSLYRDSQDVLPEQTLWGIRDEYTGEMSVPFQPIGTQCSYDERGNYMILDTNLLEPERYYRLLFEVDNGEGKRRVYDSKNIFRVTRHGEL